MAYLVARGVSKHDTLNDVMAGDMQPLFDALKGPHAEAARRRDHSGAMLDARRRLWLARAAQDVVVCGDDSDSVALQRARHEEIWGLVQLVARECQVANVVNHVADLQRGEVVE